MSLFRCYWLGLALVLIAAPLPAPGQYPPGQYPPGQYPPGTGGVGIPIPHRHKKDDQAAQLQSTSGMLRRILKDQVVLEADDHRILNFKRTDATHFLKMGNAIKAADLKPGDLVEVESSEDDEGFLTAVNVMWQQDGSTWDRKHAAEPVETSIAKGSHQTDSAKGSKDAKDSASEGAQDSAAPAPDQPAAKPASQAAAQAPATATTGDPNPADLNAPAKDEVKSVQIDPDDQGPPVLKRGGQAVHKDVEPAPAPAPGASAPAPELSARNEPPATESEPPTRASLRPEEVVIEKAREAAGNFLESLPNYVCHEIMTRYQSAPNSKNWQPLDIVSMALVYENRKESYRDLEINGKPTKKSIEDLSGSWSTGEFGSVLADIFSPATAADFEYRRQSRSGGRSALVYDFSVEREHSHWRIMVGSQLITPPYVGSVWIDKETNRVLRIEMQATHIPEAFPTDKVEMATDYEFVRFEDRQFLVPVHAENLGCQRGTDTCSRNTIDFRNYHKYSGEATIIFK